MAKKLNIIIKGFEKKFGKEIVERALQNISVGYCASILNNKVDLPDVHADACEWYDATDLRMEDGGGGYFVDWNTIPPLDEKIIYEMRECEAVVLEMMCRFERDKKISYEERKRIYLQHLRFWNYIIETQDIGCFLMSHIPHQCFDNVIYDLCKKKGIPVFMSYAGIIKDSLIFSEDWEESSIVMKERYVELLKEMENVEIQDISLSESCAKYFWTQTEQKDDPTAWYMGTSPKHSAERSLFDWFCIGYKYLLRSPGKCLKTVVSSSFWKKKFSQNTVYNFYEKNASHPDLTKKYIYVALHYQPECSSAPLAGAYVDQYLIVQMLSALVPDNVLIYVKEHPHQAERCRSINFYRDMLTCRNVQFVPRNFKTFPLTEHALAVATATGTVGFEALLREKPVLMFGHRFYQYAPGVYMVHSADDCRNALRGILEEGRHPSIRDVKIFMKAYDDVQIRAYIGKMFAPVTELSWEENIENYGSALEPLLLRVYNQM